MESKKNRFEKGSEEAKKFMAELRSKRGKKGGGSTPPPLPSSPVNCECPPPTEKPKTKRSNKKNIVVDF
jgi:hypothetical protein